MVYVVHPAPEIIDLNVRGKLANRRILNLRNGTDINEGGSIGHVFFKFPKRMAQPKRDFFGDVRPQIRSLWRKTSCRASKFTTVALDMSNRQSYLAHTEGSQMWIGPCSAISLNDGELSDRGPDQAHHCCNRNLVW